MCDNATGFTTYETTTGVDLGQCPRRTRLNPGEHSYCGGAEGLLTIGNTAGELVLVYNLGGAAQAQSDSDTTHPATRIADAGRAAPQQTTFTDSARITFPACRHQASPAVEFLFLILVLLKIQLLHVCSVGSYREQVSAIPPPPADARPCLTMPLGSTPRTIFEKQELRVRSLRPLMRRRSPSTHLPRSGIRPPACACMTPARAFCTPSVANAATLGLQPPLRHGLLSRPTACWGFCELPKRANGC